METKKKMPKWKISFNIFRDCEMCTGAIKLKMRWITIIIIKKEKKLIERFVWEANIKTS